MAIYIRQLQTKDSSSELELVSVRCLLVVVLVVVVGV